MQPSRKAQARQRHKGGTRQKADDAVETITPHRDGANVAASNGALGEGLHVAPAAAAGVPPSPVLQASADAKIASTSPPGANDSLFAFALNELSWGHASGVPPATPDATSEYVASFLRTPLRMEACVSFTHALCGDLFLFHFTLLPVRALHAALCILAGLLRPFRTVPASLQLTRAGLFACLKVAIIACVTATLGLIQVSRVYHYIRGEAVIKLYVIFNILEILDKLFASLGQDIMDSLYRYIRDADVLPWGSTVATDAAAQRGAAGPPRRRGTLALHLLIAVVYVTLHSVIIFVQIVCLNVAINSKHGALLTLLVSNNFVELKGNVFKRFEAENLFQITCSDGVERFQISLFLALIAMQEATSWPALTRLAPGMLSIVLMEVLVDYFKHSFISKFNRLHADLYSIFSATLAHDMISVRGRMRTTLDPTHARSRRVGLATLPLACVVLRMVLSNVHPSWFPTLTTLPGAVAIAIVILTLASIKVLSSMLLISIGARIISAQRDKLARAVHMLALTSPRQQHPRTPAAMDGAHASAGAGTAPRGPAAAAVEAAAATLQQSIPGLQLSHSEMRIALAAAALARVHSQSSMPLTLSSNTLESDAGGAPAPLPSAASSADTDAGYTAEASARAPAENGVTPLHAHLDRIRAQEARSGSREVPHSPKMPRRNSITSPRYVGDAMHMQRAVFADPELELARSAMSSGTSADERSLRADVEHVALLERITSTQRYAIAAGKAVPL